MDHCSWMWYHFLASLGLKITGRVLLNDGKMKVLGNVIEQKPWIHPDIARYLFWTHVWTGLWSEPTTEQRHLPNVSVTRFSLLRVTKRLRWIWASFWWIRFPNQLCTTECSLLFFGRVFCSSQKIWRTDIWIFEKRPWNEGLKRFKPNASKCLASQESNGRSFGQLEDERQERS